MLGSKIGQKLRGWRTQSGEILLQLGDLFKHKLSCMFCTFHLLWGCPRSYRHAIMEGGGTMNAAAAFNAPLLVARSTLLLRGMISHLGREGSVHSPRFPASNSGFRSLPLRINPAPHKSTRRLYCSISSHVSGLRKWRLPRSPLSLPPSLSTALRTDRTLSKWTWTAAAAGQYQIDGQTSLKYSLSAALRRRPSCRLCLDESSFPILK